jgi:hypothetical protein
VPLPAARMMAARLSRGVIARRSPVEKDFKV